MIYYIIIIFIFLWLFLSKLTANGRFNAGLLAIPIFILLWLVMGLRGDSVGMDTAHYHRIFDMVSLMPLKDIFQKVLYIEPGWKVMIKGVSELGGGFLSFQLITSAIFSILYCSFFLYANKAFRLNKVVLMILVSLPTLYLLSFNAARQMFAVMLVACSWSCFVAQKYKGAVLLFLIALSIHTSSLFAIPIYLIWIYRKWRLIGVVSIVSLIVIGILFTTVIAYLTKYGIYVKYLNNKSDFHQTANMAKIVWAIIAAHAFWIIWKRKKYPEYAQPVAIYCIIYVFTNMFAEDLNYFERLGLFYLPFVSIVYPIVAKEIKKPIIKYLYIGCIVLSYSIWFILSSQSGQYVYSLAEGF